MLNKADSDLSSTAVLHNSEDISVCDDRLSSQYPSAPRKIWQSFPERLSATLVLICDYLSLILAIVSALHLRNLALEDSYPLHFTLDFNNQLLFFVIPLFYIGLTFYEGLYQRRLPFWQSAGKLIKVYTFATCFAVALLYFSGVIKSTSRLFIGFLWILSCVFIIVTRFLVKRALAAVGLWRKWVIVVGEPDTVAALAKSFAEEPGLGYQIAGVIEKNHSRNHRVAGCPVLGNLNNLEAAITGSGVSEVIISLADLARPDLLALVYRIQPLVRNVTIVPDLDGLPLSNLEADTFFNQKAVMLRVRNNLLHLRNRILKRCLDVICGTALLVLCSPLMLLAGLSIALDSPGPVIYAGRRLGKKGREFKCYKFRTMFLNEGEILAKHLAENGKAREEWQRFAKLKVHDPRVTRVGKWLRQFSLDELPQLFNVIKGDMSLVGPRPYLPSERERLGLSAKTILKAVPGITGLWQVRGRNDLEFTERLSLDTWYIRNWSIWLDITLMLRTVWVVVRKKGAY